jgi:hypothetical protein
LRTPAPGVRRAAIMGRHPQTFTLAECRIASVARVVRSRQHAVSRSTLVNGESKKTGAAHG